MASLVVAVSEPNKELEWKLRKQHTLADLADMNDRDVLGLVAADKLDNVRSISDSLRHLGNKKTWKLF